MWWKIALRPGRPCLTAQAVAVWLCQWLPICRHQSEPERLFCCSWGLSLLAGDPMPHMRWGTDLAVATTYRLCPQPLALAVPATLPVPAQPFPASPGAFPPDRASMAKPSGDEPREGNARLEEQEPVAAPRSRCLPRYSRHILCQGCSSPSLLPPVAKTFCAMGVLSCHLELRCGSDAPAKQGPLRVATAMLPRQTALPRHVFICLSTDPLSRRDRGGLGVGGDKLAASLGIGEASLKC